MCFRVNGTNGTMSCVTLYLSTIKRTEQAQQTLMVKMGYLRKGKLVVPPIGQRRFSDNDEENEEWE